MHSDSCERSEAGQTQDTKLTDRLTQTPSEQLRAATDERIRSVLLNLYLGQSNTRRVVKLLSERRETLTLPAPPNSPVV